MSDPFLAAALETVLRLNEVVYAPFYALFIVGPIALLVEHWLQSRRQRQRELVLLPLRRFSMKTFTRWIVAVIVSLLVGLSAQAQNLAGQWQGTLPVGNGIRFVIVVSANAAGGGYRATFYSIDQSQTGVAAPLTAQGSVVRFEVAAAGVTYEGRLSADGNSIAGNFSQGPNKLPLTLARATKETAFPIPEPPRAMAADAPLAFELATVKPSAPDTPGKAFTMRGREVLTINTTLADMITMAYDMHVRQVIGGPSWMTSDKYDVTGRPQAEGIPSMVQLRGMIRSLLQDRFKLTFHREKRDLPAYALTVVNNTPKLTPNTTSPNGPPGLMFRGLGVLPAVNATMIEFATVMQTAVLDRPVVDRTGLQGKFDFTLNWTPDESQFRSMGVQVPPPPADAKFPGLFTAIQEQLGLKLESVTAPVEVMVIDRVERPSEN